MTDKAQRLAKVVGETGCYFLSLCFLAEKDRECFVDVLYEADRAMKSGSLGQDCYVQDAARIFSDLTKKSFRVLKAGPDHPLPLSYECADREYEILRFEYVEPPGKTFAHFVVGDGKGRVVWDPLGDSTTVARGELVSKRVLRRTA